jgi:hypothetical protein
VIEQIDGAPPGDLAFRAVAKVERQVARAFGANR